MKQALLFSIVLIRSFLVHAQDSWRDLYQDDQHTRFVNHLLRAQSGSAAAQKPTTLQQRVVAQASGNSFSRDSLTYKYSGARGSRFDHNTLGFSYDYNFSINYDPMVSPFYESGGMNMLADSILTFGNGDTANQKSGAYYRSDNKRDSVCAYFFDGEEETFAKTANSYYPGGYLKESLTQTGPAVNTLEPANLRRLTYNSIYTKVISDSIWFNFGLGMQPFQAMRYHYNSLDKVDTIYTYAYNNGSFALSLVASIRYTATGWLQQVNQYNSINDTLYPVWTDTFGYTGNNPWFSFHEYHSFGPDGNMDFGGRQVKYMGSNNQPDSVILYTNTVGSWDETATLKYTYNSFNNPERITSSNGSNTIRFYYELYDDAMDIDPLAQNKDFSLYPNPFSNDLYIDWKGKESKVAVSLYNMIGQEVYHGTLSLRNGKNILSIPGLNTGHYILLLRDTQGKTWSSKVLSR